MKNSCIKISQSKHLQIFLFFIFIIFASLNYKFAYSQAAELLDMTKIKAEITDEKSDFFYPNLYKRYSENDTTLTPYEYRYLYYGHSLQPYFDPNITSSNDSVVALRKYLFESEVSVDRVLELTGFVLRLDPFFVDGIFLTALSYEKLANSAIAREWFIKYTNLIKTILASGNGKSVDSPFVVLSVSDEFAILDALELEFKEQKIIEQNGKFYEVLSVNENTKGFTEVFFDINLFYDRSKSFKRK